ncbi:LEM3 (ligand-effect modulator 3) family protein / CDC50 family protein [Rhynchospora pubera]|uniref:ALA-interacting subunit n=1 Tax=Rhynchospora pubera TaxID=906938 RepID=A0AAV8G4S5_9POAL|nr:LEM3 (ligand-effect modulator 3) family protein / CDC50 family protein [Rhynchospora pubera]
MNHANNTGATSSSGSGDAANQRRTSRRPKYSKFTQQELPACKPILTPKWVISVFTIIGVIFIPIGVASLWASRDVVEVVDRYDNACLPSNATNKDAKIAYIQNRDTDKNCTRTITITKDMNQPIYVYYQLDNFYQNHRRYVKSRNDQQLRDKSKANETDYCDPEKTTADGKPIVPCGLIAWSLFNDTYSFARGSENITVNRKHISWKSDRDHKFGSDVFPSNFQNGTLIGGKTLDPNVSLSQQEDLIVWMRTAALPTFRKLWGKIEKDLKANDVITINLENNYNTYEFNGKKKLVLSTASWLGGKNDFLGLAYLSVGGLCFFLALLFTLLYLIKPRKLGDPSYLSWNRNPAGR